MNETRYAKLTINGDKKTV